LKYDGALKSGFAYLSRCNSGWFCHKYDPLKSTTSKIRVSVRKLPQLPNMTGKSMFPKGYTLMPKMIPRKGKTEVQSLDREMPMVLRVSTYKMLRLLPACHTLFIRT
jgi:hypothetical protein